MAAPLVPDDLWAALLPLEAPKPKGGRPRVPDRAAPGGIVFVPRAGIQWRDVPVEMGCSGETCWRRLVERHAAGVRRALHRVLLGRPRGADRLDWGRASPDSAAVRAKGGARRPGPIRRTEARRARSGTWSSTARARRSA